MQCAVVPDTAVTVQPREGPLRQAEVLVRLSGEYGGWQS